MLCDLCLSWSGRTTKGAPCCEIRALAELPKVRRQAVYAQVKQEQGDEALQQLKAAVMVEYQRRQEFLRNRT